MGKNVSDEAYDAWVEAFKAAYASPEFAKIQKEKGVNGKRCQIYFPKELLVFSSMLSVFTAILCSLCALLSVVFCATKKVRFQQKVIGISVLVE